MVKIASKIKWDENLKQNYVRNLPAEKIEEVNRKIHDKDISVQDLSVIITSIFNESATATYGRKGDNPNRFQGKRFIIAKLAAQERKNTIQHAINLDVQKIG